MRRGGEAPEDRAGGRFDDEGVRHRRQQPGGWVGGGPETLCFGHVSANPRFHHQTLTASLNWQHMGHGGICHNKAPIGRIFHKACILREMSGPPAATEFVEAQ